MATPKQIASLKYVVFKSKDGNKLAKRLIAFALDQSEGLTKSVRIKLEYNYQGYKKLKVREAWSALHAMRSSLGTTHLNELLGVMGVDFFFGAAEHNGSCELWLSMRVHPESEFILVNRRELEAIDLTRPGLYPTLENQRWAA